MVEAYKVGITIALTNQISRGLMMIQGDLAKTDAQAKKLHATLGQIKKLGMIGAAVGGAGFMGLKALDKGYEAAKKYEQGLNQFKALNLGDAINKDADKFARGSQLIGVSATDLIGTVKELHTVLNNYGESKAFAPIIAQMQYANKAVGGEKGASAFNEGQRQMMGKVLEYRGGTSAETQLVQAEYMQHVMSGTGYMVMPRDYRNMLSTGKIAAQQMSNDAFYYKTEPLAQFMSGNAVGTGLMTSYNRMIYGMGAGSPGGKAYIELLEKLGLTKKGFVERNKTTGKITKVLPDFLKDSDKYKTDPFAFLEENFVPALQAAGYDDRGIQTAIQQVYGRTGGAVFNQYHSQYVKGKAQGKFATDEKAMGLDALLKLAKTSPQGAELALGAAWENLKISAGEALIPVVIPALLKLADAFRDLGKWINQHPVKFDYLIKGFAGLSAVLVMGGSVLLLTASLKGLGLMMDFTLGPSVTKAVTGIGGLATKLGLLGGAAYGVYDLIANHQKYADAIDEANPGFAEWYDKTTAGMHDGILKRALRPYEESAVPPPSSSKPIQLTTSLNVDGRQLATAVTQHQTATANTPATSGSDFDGRQGIIQPAWGW